MSDLDLYRNFDKLDPLSLSEKLLALPPVSDGGLSLHNEPEAIEVPPVLVPPGRNETH